MSEKSCSTCLYQNDDGDCVAEQCNFDMSGWRPKDNKPITFVDKIKEALPNSTTLGTINPVYIERHTEPMKEKFSLDKLIDDHWNYVGEMLLVHGTEDAVIAIVGFHYKSAFRHGFKHCMEHYGIEEKNDD